MNNISIQLKIIISIVFFTIFIVVLERYSLSENVVKQFIESKKSKNDLLINTISPIIGLNISLGLDEANKDYLDQIVEQNSDIEHIRVTDISGKIIYSYPDKSGFESNEHDDGMNFSEKTILDNITGDELAKINLHFLNKEYQSVLEKNKETTLKIFTITFILLVIFILAIKREFRHLESLSKNVLEYDPKINNLKLTASDRKDEVGIIHNAIISMVTKIEEHSKALDEINVSLEKKVKQRTKELEYSNNEFKYMLDNTMEGVGIFENNRCINLNQAAINIFGYSGNIELLGKSPLIFIAPEFHDITIKKIQEKNSEPYESVGIKQDGTQFPILVKGTTFINDDITYRITSMMDLTKIKENERLLELAKTKAEESTKAKSDFLANMSHEIRTPMNGIIGMTHLVKQTKLDDKQMDYLTKIETASNNLLNIINDILDFSKAEAGKLNIEHVDFDMNNVISNVKSLVEFKANEKKLDFNIFYDSKNSMFIGDQLRISQVLINLLNNAIKFTETGSVELFIEPSDTNNVRFIVQDTGIGLTEEQQSKLFKSFSQADESTTRKYGGTGLGLSISKQLVELMHGKIWVESEIGKGSRFIFELKLSEGNTKKIKRPSTAKSLNKLMEDMKSIQHSNILLVEDNKTNQEIILGILEDVNIDIDIANNGQEAIELHRTNPNKYKLIFMDVQMPIIDGISATKIIRQIDKQIPIIALSANVMKDDIEKSALAGMNEHLNKPIEVNKIYEILLKYLPKNSDFSSLKNGHKEDVTIPVMEHIDTSVGLKYSANNKKLYIKILNSFLQNYRALNIDNLNEEEFKNTMHSMKGLSVNIGALSLCELAETLEETYDKKLSAKFQKKLTSILDELENKLLFDNKDISKKKSISQNELNELFLKLKEAAQTKRPKNCEPVLERIEECLLSDEDKELYVKVKNLIEKYKLQEAADILEKTV